MNRITTSKMNHDKQRTVSPALLVLALVFVGWIFPSAFSWSPSRPSIRFVGTKQHIYSHSGLHTGSRSHRLSASFVKMARSSTPECSIRAQEFFSGQICLLTGASGGLGRSLAIQMTKCGAKAIILSARDQTSLEQVAKECHEAAAAEKESIEIHVVPCDLSDPESVSKLCQDSLKAAGGAVDVLVNNGGISSRSRFLSTTTKVDELVMRVNFLSGAQLAKAVAPGMVDKKKGAIIWIGSVQGLLGIPNRTSYAASKFAVQGYSEALRAELSSSGVTVHVASPGYIRTNLSRSAITGDGEKHGKMDESTANGADPDGVAVRILNSVANGKADFIVAAGVSTKVAILLRQFAPSFLNFMLAKRYDKSIKENTQGEE